MSKDSLLKGTLILTFAAFIARFLGMAQRVPLQHILGDAGQAVYGVANTWYLVLLPIATAGIPSALSKLISEKTALGRHVEADRILRAALWFALVAGLFITLVLYAAAPLIANASGIPESAASIRAMAPALLLFPIIAMLRGYFQGRQRMTPGGISQIVEQIVRVVTSIGLAGILLWVGYGIEGMAAGASFGAVFGGIGALGIMLLYFSKLKRIDRNKRSAAAAGGASAARGGAMTVKQIYTVLLKLAIPMSLFSASVQLVYLVDSMLGVPLLKGQIGSQQAQELLGALLGRAQSLAGIPVIFAVAISQSLVPVISFAYAKRDMDEVGNKASQAIRLGLFTGIPVIAAITVAADPVNRLIFADSHGTSMIALLTAGTIFQIIMMTTGAILMGIGRMRALIVNVVLMFVIKLAGSIALAYGFGMDGMVVATMLAFLAAAAMNVALLRRLTPMKLFNRRKWAGLAVTVAVMSGVGLGVFELCRLYITPFGNRLDDLLHTLLVCGVVVALYPALLALTRVVTPADAASFPAPVRKLLARGARLLGRG
ncbi:MAG: polysaccharide biosynthesis protein [Paenibacillaceae bacterium]|nr:polysaccharide biosynthesis protein [Paenibacillaceae bacterium]